jgi:hypothetical protein
METDTQDGESYRSRRRTGETLALREQVCSHNALHTLNPNRSNLRVMG